MEFITPSITAIQMSGGGTLYIKRIEIGGWNLDVDRVKWVPHGLDWSKIIGGSVVLIRDDGGSYQPILLGAFNEPSYPKLPHWTWTSVNVGIHMGTEFLLSGNYDDDTINRGYVTLFYTD